MNSPTTTTTLPIIIVGTADNGLVAGRRPQIVVNGVAEAAEHRDEPRRHE